MIPIPARMQKLDRDRRGLPVPVIVLRNDDGTPLFAANDGQAVQKIIAQDRCEVCGEKLLRGRWFVGGHLSAFAEHGRFLDPPMHDECAHYALQVCPYMAAPSYGRLVGKTALARSDRKDIIQLDDPTAANTRPPFFVAVMVVGQVVSTERVLPGVDVEMSRLFHPKPGSVRRVEIWLQGRQIVGAALKELKEFIGASLASIDEKPRADLWALL